MRPHAPKGSIFRVMQCLPYCEYLLIFRKKLVQLACRIWAMKWDFIVVVLRMNKWYFNLVPN